MEISWKQQKHQHPQQQQKKKKRMKKKKKKKEGAIYGGTKSLQAKWFNDEQE